MAARHLDATMYVPRMGVFLNRWFANYEQARVALERDGGFLFPHERQFFITVQAAVRELGLDPSDPDWERIGFDWARPRDPEAWERLSLKRQVAA